MRILITGAAGQIGQALIQELSSKADLISATRSELDLAHSGYVAEQLCHLKPDVIINAGAYTAVDNAEGESDQAFAVNALGVGALGNWAKGAGIPLVHFSTDYVFDGSASVPYGEDDAVNPLSIYGKSKVEGEKLLLESGAECLIIRTTWVYSSIGKNFLNTVLRLASEKQELGIVADQFGTPTSAAQIARFVGSFLEDGSLSLSELFKQSGHVVHFTATGSTTWHGFANEIVSGAKRRGFAIKATTVKPISTIEYKTLPVRPKYSRLSLERLHRVFVYTPDHWQIALDRELDLLIGTISS